LIEVLQQGGTSAEHQAKKAEKIDLYTSGDAEKFKQQIKALTGLDLNIASRSLV